MSFVNFEKRPSVCFEWRGEGYVDLSRWCGTPAIERREPDASRPFVQSGSMALSSASTNGKVNQKVVIFPGSETNPISPPMRSTICLEMFSPQTAALVAPRRRRICLRKRAKNAILEGNGNAGPGVCYANPNAFALLLDTDLNSGTL